MEIIKRDNTKEQYDINKIKKVLNLSFINSNTNCNNLDELVIKINEEIKNKESITVEEIQNIVEKTLVYHNYYDTVKHYIEYRQRRSELRKKESYITKIPDDIDTPWGMLGYITYKRTYSRIKDEDKETTEEYRDTILRVLDASQKQLKVNFTNDELRKAYKYLMSLKCSVAGRFLWQLGTNTVDKLGIMSLQNCAFVKIDEPIKPFIWIFDVLMLGTGVGFSIERKNISKLPIIIDNDINISRLDTNDADFIIPDSREGWVSLLEKILEAFYYKGKSFTYSTILIRSAGKKIKGFGGTASGPEDLVKGLKNIIQILKRKRGKQLSSIDCLDIVNIIATIVVAGNVRRSALLCLGDYDDIEYLKAKDWSSGNIPNWRCMSNNSVVCEDISKLPNEFWEGYNGTSEPYGLINIELSKKVGRIKDGSKYPDKDVEGYNPCLTGDTFILTTEGPMQIEKLIGKEFTAIINNKEYKSTDKGFWLSGEKEVYKIELKNGLIIKATDNHKFLTKNGWKEVKNMIDTDELNLSINDYVWNNGLGIETDGKNIASLINIEEGNDFNDNLINRSSYSFLIGFMKKLYEINGYVIRNNIILSHTNTSLIKKIQIILINLGINSNLTSNILNNNITISEYSDIVKFNELIGFNDTTKDDKVKSIIENIKDKKEERTYYSKIYKITKEEQIEKVYDCTINEIHSFSANGIISHNCAEQSLANYETCCLSEIYLSNITSYEELKDVAKTLYRICKHSLLLKSHQEDTEKIVHENNRMGIGITGFMQASEEQKSWLSPLYEYIREYDEIYSKENNIKTSVKLTTVKPSGTLSLLAGVTSGCHPGIYQYFIRRIRIASNNNLIKLCKSKGYYTEYQKNFDGTDDKNTIIVEFPCKYPIGTKLAKDMSAIEQLETVKHLQTNWSDNAVSCTIYYRLEELDEIKEWLKINYKENVKTCSFLLHNEHGFKQAPFEEITEDKYNELIKKVEHITKGNINIEDDIDYSSECVGGACPIK